MFSGFCVPARNDDCCRPNREIGTPFINALCIGTKRAFLNNYIWLLPPISRCSSCSLTATSFALIRARLVQKKTWRAGVRAQSGRFFHQNSSCVDGLGNPLRYILSGGERNYHYSSRKLGCRLRV